MSLLRGSYLHKLSFHKNFSSMNNVKTKSNELSSFEIRNMFLDFFIDKNNHKFIRSSPVIPFCDPTVPFVNAGMNQVLKMCATISFHIQITMSCIDFSLKMFS